MRAFQAAYASVLTASRRTDSAGLVEEGLVEAILVGNDTDTVAAIAGGLLGGLAGLGSIPEQWVRDINGWPGYRADGLVQMAHAIVGQGSGTD